MTIINTRMNIKNGTNYVTHHLETNDEMVLVDNGTLTLKEKINNYSYYITPEMFGYKNNVDVSINESLQKCFDYCRDNNGGTIIVKNGNHKSNGTMSIYKNTKLILENGAIIQCLGTTPTPLVNGKRTDVFTEYNGNGNIYIEGGTWISNNLGQLESNRNLFGIAHADGLTIKNVTFKNVKSSHCIDLNSSKNVLIENCNFQGFKDADDKSRTFAEAIQIAEHTPLGFDGVGSPDRTPCKNITIKDCYFGPSEIYGAFGCGLGNHSSVHDVYQENIRVENCEFNGMLFAGVRPFKWRNFSVRNCKFIKCLTGVIITSVKSGSLSSEDKDGIQSNQCQSGDGYFIQNNYFEDCKNQAITVNGQITRNSFAFVSNIIISENIIKYTSPILNINGAIYMQRITDFKIINNTIDNSTRGIWLKYCNNGNITGNIINKATNEGIFINENSDDVDDTTLLNGNHFTNTIVFDKNTIVDVGRTAINFGYVNNFKVSNNRVRNACIETVATRNAIVIGATCKNGEVFNNKVENVDNLKNKYGLEVTSTCVDIECYNNDCYGITGALSFSQNALKEKKSFNSVKWFDCSLNSGITPYTDYQKPQFTKNSDGMVTIRGGVTHSKTFRGVLFTLPIDYRPSKLTYFVTLGSSGNDEIPFINDVKLNRIYVTTSGEVRLESTTSVSDLPFTSLDLNFYIN